MNSQKGQTFVEYLLVIVVVVAVANTIFNKLEDYLLNNPDSIQNQYLSGFRNSVQGQNEDFSGQFRFFKIRR